MSFPSGKIVIGRLVNTAANTVQSIAFKDVNGKVHTFVTGERLIIKTVQVNNRATAKDITIFQDGDADGAVDSGEELVAFSFAGQDNAQAFFEGLPAQKVNAGATNTFKALASAVGAVDVIVVGEVVNS